ncbi:MAG: hypothetical protein V3574_02740 [Candidatus Moraniibacteriota bacterium]
MIKFADLKEDVQIRRCTIPQAVFVTENPDDETMEQVMERQERFLKLPEAIKNKLVSYETADKIKAIGAHYNLELLQMAPIARVIRSYYFGEAKLEDFAAIIERESKISKEEAENIARYVKDRIISRDVKRSEAVKTEKMPIEKALRAFPELRNQKITTQPIESEEQMISPNLNNWIEDYYNLVGAGNKDIMKRSSYLYHSKNTKKLSPSERQNLSQVIKSLEEGTPVGIDVQKKEIVFESIPERTIAQREIIATSPQGNIGTIGNPIREISSKNFFDVKKKELPQENKERHAAFGEIEADKNEEDLNKKTTIKHVHGNNWNLGSAHFGEAPQVKKSGWSFLRSIKKEETSKKEENDLEGVNNLKFSSTQKLPVEKEKEEEMIPNLRKEPTQRTAINPKSDFFGRINPLE